MPDNGESSDPTAPARTELSARLRAVRARTGKSLKELQTELHISDSSLSRYLAGQTVPPWDVVVRLCQVAGVHPASLRALWVDANTRPQAAAPGSSGAEAGTVGRQDDPSRPARWWSIAAGDRRRLGAVLVSAVVLVAIGMCAGAWLESTSAGSALAGLLPWSARSGPAAQDATCRDLPWPPPGGGRTVERSARAAGVDHTPTVELATDTLDGESVVWAQITGGRYGDRVWLDVTHNGGQTWSQCGPFTATDATATTRAYQMAPGWQFRACGDTPKAAPDHARHACTEFW